MIRMTDHGAVLELRLDRPDKKNAITGAMYDALSGALEDAAQGPVRVVLLTAEGPVFTAGNDINDFLAMKDLLNAPPAGFIGTLARFPKPIVAAVPGAAIGVGTTMLLHCDLVYAAPAARFSVPFVDLGLVPEAGSSLLLPMLLGSARANAMLLLGEPIDADVALGCGLVNAIVPPEELDAAALRVAQRLAQKPPAALAASRALIRRGRGVLEAQMQAEQAAFGAALNGPESKEAFTAFLERRPPRF